MTAEDREYLDEQFARIGNRLDAMDAHFDGIDQRLDGMDTRFDGVDRRLDGVDAAIRKLGLDMETKYQNVQLLAEQFSTLQEVTNRKVAVLADRVDDRLIALEAAVRGLYTRQSSS